MRHHGCSFEANPAPKVKEGRWRRQFEDRWKWEGQGSGLWGTGYSQKTQAILRSRVDSLMSLPSLSKPSWETSFKLFATCCDFDFDEWAKEVPFQIATLDLLRAGSPTSRSQLRVIEESMNTYDAWILDDILMNLDDIYIQLYTFRIIYNILYIYISIWELIYLRTFKCIQFTLFASIQIDLHALIYKLLSRCILHIKQYRHVMYIK